MTTNAMRDWTEEEYDIIVQAQKDVGGEGETIPLNLVIEAIRIAQQKEKAKLSKYLIDQLSEANPYPSDVFIPRSKEEMKAVSDLIAKAGYSPDAVFGQFGRQVWNNAVDKLKDLSEY